MNRIERSGTIKTHEIAGRMFEDEVDVGDYGRWRKHVVSLVITARAF